MENGSQIENIWKIILRHWEREREREIDELSQIKSLKKISINIENWKPFLLKDLFIIKRGKRIVRDEDYKTEIIDDFKIPVITPTTNNNSIDGFYNESNSGGNVLVCGGEALGMFTTYHKKPIWVMDRSRILKCKYEKFNEFIALFFIPILNANMFRFSYGRSANPNHIENLMIKLPADSNGQPDWEYMENYIKSLPYSKYI